MHMGDPLMRLRAANPIPPATVTEFRADPALFRAITTGTLGQGGAQTRRRARRRRARIAVPALAVAGLLGGAVAYGVLGDGAPKPHTVACYERADLEAHAAVVGVGREGPVAACAALWERGAFGSDREVPALAECLLPIGVVAVFPATPGHDVCRAVAGSQAPAAATTAPSPTLADVNDRFLAFREAVRPQFLDVPCVDPKDAAAIVRRELDRAGLSAWTVRSGPFSPERPCATLSFRPEQAEVVLVPGTPRR